VQPFGSKVYQKARLYTVRATLTEEANAPSWYYSTHLSTTI